MCIRDRVEGAQTEQNIEGSYSEFRYFVEELRDQIVKDKAAADVVNVTEGKRMLLLTLWKMRMNVNKWIG